MSTEQQRSTPALPPWYRRHAEQCLRAFSRLIPSKKHTSSTTAYVNEYCRINGLKQDNGGARNGY